MIVVVAVVVAAAVAVVVVVAALAAAVAPATVHVTMLYTRGLFIMGWLSGFSFLLIRTLLCGLVAPRNHRQGERTFVLWVHVSGWIQLFRDIVF
jgi:hypothetical protein